MPVGYQIPEDPSFFEEGKRSGGGGGGSGLGGGTPQTPFVPPAAGGGGFPSFFPQMFTPQLPQFGGSRRLFMSIPSGAMRTAFTGGSLAPPQFHSSGASLAQLLTQLMGRQSAPQMGPMTYNNPIGGGA